MAKEIDREALEYCISQGWGENRAIAYLGVGPTAYRKAMRKHGLKSPHLEFSNKTYHANMPLCPLCKNRKHHTGFCCSKCRRVLNDRAIKIFLIMLLGGKCSICGYNKSSFALEFHHINPIY